MCGLGLQRGLAAERAGPLCCGVEPACPKAPWLLAHWAHSARARAACQSGSHEARLPENAWHAASSPHPLALRNLLPIWGLKHLPKNSVLIELRNKA